MALAFAAGSFFQLLRDPVPTHRSGSTAIFWTLRNLASPLNASPSSCAAAARSSDVSERFDAVPTRVSSCTALKGLVTEESGAAKLMVNGYYSFPCSRGRSLGLGRAVTARRSPAERA
jgi:hypothetical protein